MQPKPRNVEVGLLRRLQARALDSISGRRHEQATEGIMKGDKANDPHGPSGRPTSIINAQVTRDGIRQQVGRGWRDERAVA